MIRRIRLAFVVLRSRSCCRRRVHRTSASSASSPTSAWCSTLAVAYEDGPETGAIFGFADGARMDLFLTTPLGLSALSYALTGYVGRHLPGRASCGLQPAGARPRRPRRAHRRAAVHHGRGPGRPGAAVLSLPSAEDRARRRALRRRRSPRSCSRSSAGPAAEPARPLATPPVTHGPSMVSRCGHRASMVAAIDSPDASDDQPRCGSSWASSCSRCSAALFTAPVVPPGRGRRASSRPRPSRTGDAVGPRSRRSAGRILDAKGRVLGREPARRRRSPSTAAAHRAEREQARAPASPCCSASPPDGGQRAHRRPEVLAVHSRCRSRSASRTTARLRRRAAPSDFPATSSSTPSAVREYPNGHARRARARLRRRRSTTDELDAHQGRGLRSSTTPSARTASSRSSSRSCAARPGIEHGRGRQPRAASSAG